jgi:hypothetical protein
MVLAEADSAFQNMPGAAPALMLGKELNKAKKLNKISLFTVFFRLEII